MILRYATPILLLSSVSIPAAAQSSEIVSLGAQYVVDVLGVAYGGSQRGARVLDDLDLTLDMDLDRAVGWRGVAAHVDVLRNHGARPNDLAGSIQGIDNIEVNRRGVRLYEAWIERQAGAASLRLGLYDLNSDFYSNDAASLFVASPFGMGSELSASGPNGPSTFPSTALAARVRVSRSSYFLQGALINAEAGTIGDAQGIDVSGRAGLLVIAELGYAATSKVALGVWRYTKKQPVFAARSKPAPDRVSQGIYALVEHSIIGSDTTFKMTPFLRAGVSDGVTTPFQGGWQAGLRFDRIIPTRPDAILGVGVARGSLTNMYRRNESLDGLALLSAETIIEATLSDEVAPGITIQPDVQYVITPNGRNIQPNPLILGLRCAIAIGSK